MLKSIVFFLVLLHSISIFGYDCNNEVDQYNKLQGVSVSDFILDPTSLKTVDINYFDGEDFDQINNHAVNTGAIGHYLKFGSFESKSGEDDKQIDSGRLLVRSDKLNDGEQEKVVINTTSGLKVIDGRIFHYSLVDMNSWIEDISTECKLVDYMTYFNASLRELETDCAYIILKPDYFTDYLLRKSCKKNIEMKTKRPRIVEKKKSESILLETDLVKGLDDVEIVDDEFLRPAEVSNILSGMYAYKIKGLYLFNGSYTTGRDDDSEMIASMGVVKRFKIADDIVLNLGVGHAAKLYMSSDENMNLKGGALYGSLFTKYFQIEMNYTAIDNVGENQTITIRTGFQF